MKVFILFLSLLIVTSVPSLAENDNAQGQLILLVDSYSLDESSIEFHPESSERVLHTYSGGIYYKTEIIPEFWTLDIIRAGSRIPCKIHCQPGTYPKLDAKQNMPMGVIHYLKANICENKIP